MWDNARAIAAEFAVSYKEADLASAMLLNSVNNVLRKNKNKTQEKKNLCSGFIEPMKKTSCNLYFGTDISNKE